MTDNRFADAARRWWGGIRPSSDQLKDDSIAAIPRAAASVPDGMAAAALVGVNPIHGLYASFAGPFFGGLTSSTRLMVITTTSAASLAAYSALLDIGVEDRPAALLLMTVIAGVFMLAAGFFGLGWLKGFVSHSVMTGFLTGVAINILLGQVAQLTGTEVEASNSVESAWLVITNPRSMDLPSVLVGVGALALLVLLPRTPLGRYAALIALIVPTVFAQVLAYFEGVDQVSDVGEIVRGLPLPSIPDLTQFSLTILTGALAVAAIVLVQGAGVAEAAPNPDGTRSDPNTDFMSQGWANVGSGLFGGIPVGGSVSQTALNLAVGATGRWASIMSGVFMLVVLVALSGLAGRVAMPTLAAILIVASVAAIKPDQVSAVWKSGAQSQIAMATTFIATLFLPISAAVGIGVALSMLLAVNREAQDVRLVELSETSEGRFVEAVPPRKLRSNGVTVLDVYGSLFYAGARTLELMLPDAQGTENPVVVLRMRGRSVMGATAFQVLSRYAGELDDVGGRLYLSGVTPELVTQFKESARIEASSPLKLVEATPTLGESTRKAMAEAEAFLIGEAEDPVWDTPERKAWGARAASAVLGWFVSEEEE